MKKVLTLLVAIAAMVTFNGAVFANASNAPGEQGGSGITAQEEQQMRDAIDVLRKSGDPAAKKEADRLEDKLNRRTSGSTADSDNGSEPTYGKSADHRQDADHRKKAKKHKDKDKKHKKKKKDRDKDKDKDKDDDDDDDDDRKKKRGRDKDKDDD